jgi:hypothetical protein
MGGKWAINVDEDVNIDSAVDVGIDTDNRRMERYRQVRLDSIQNKPKIPGILSTIRVLEIFQKFTIKL